MKPLSQRDPRWAGIKLGSSNTTIGTHGCIITCLAMLAGTTPDVVNRRLLEVDGYADGNLVIWSKVAQALPGMRVTKLGWVYDNTDVLNNVPCLVEVSGAPIGADRHWLVYKGGKRMLDPWFGTEASTSKYTPLSYRLIKGEYKSDQESNPPVDECEKELEEMRDSRNSWKRKADEYESSREDERKTFAQTIQDKNTTIEDLQNQNQEQNLQLLENTKVIEQHVTELGRLSEDNKVLLQQKEILIATLKQQEQEIVYLKTKLKTKLKEYSKIDLLKALLGR